MLLAPKGMSEDEDLPELLEVSCVEYMNPLTAYADEPPFGSPNQIYELQNWTANEHPVWVSENGYQLWHGSVGWTLGAPNGESWYRSHPSYVEPWKVPQGDWAHDEWFLKKLYTRRGRMYYGWVIEDDVEGGPRMSPFGMPDTISPMEECASTVDPINLISGNVYFDQTDIIIPCPGIDLVFRRRYNSAQANRSVFGVGWSHSYGESLEFSYPPGERWVTLRGADGREISWRESPNGGFETSVDTGWRLTETSAGYEILQPMGITSLFDWDGALRRVSDLWGNRVDVTHTNVGGVSVVARVEHSNGQFLSLVYEDNNPKHLLSPGMDLSVDFEFNDNGEVVRRVRHVGGRTYTDTYSYFYLESPDPRLGCIMVDRANAEGRVFSYAYSVGVSERNAVKAGSISVDGQYFSHHVVYKEAENSSEVTYHRNGTDITYQYRYVTPNYLPRLNEVRGPSPGYSQTFSISPQGDVTERLVSNEANGVTVKTRTAYDDRHNPTNICFGYNLNFPDKGLQIAWDPFFQMPVSFQEPDGSLTTLSYSSGSLSRISHFHSSTDSYDTSFAYTTNGLIAAVTNANGHVTRYTHDSLGRLSLIEPPLGPVVRYTTSSLGHVLSAALVGDSGERTTSFDPDPLGRVRSVTYPDGLCETLAYDAMGNVTQQVDRAGRVTQYSYAPGSKLTAVQRQHGDGWITNSIHYDQQLNSLSFVDALGRGVESYVLDLHNRPVVVTNVENQVMQISYAIEHYIDTINRFDGSMVSNSYNGQGLLAIQVFSDSTNAFTYYQDGAMALAANQLGVVSNEYNMANRLISTIGLAPSGPVTYGYLPAGNVSSVTSLTGTISYEYDAAERLTSVDSPEATVDWSYNSDNGLVSVMQMRDAGISAGFTYDEMDRVTDITWSRSGTNTLQQFSYSYDAVGMITNVVLGSGESLRYEYDELDRLARETRMDNVVGEQLGDTAYTYDLAGNRMARSGDGVQVTYSKDYNRLTGWTASFTDAPFAALDVAGRATETIGTNPAFGELWVSNITVRTPRVQGCNFVAYGVPIGEGHQDVVAAIGDTAGNVGLTTNSITVSVVTNALYAYSEAGYLTNTLYASADTTQSVSISWNSQYKLTEVATNGVLAEAYAYDALGRRAHTVSRGSTNWYVYDGPHVIAETDDSGVLRKSYVWGPGIDNLLAFTEYTNGETNTYFCLTDHIGTVHALANESGEIVESYRYDAWGRVLGVYDATRTPLDRSAVGNHYLWQGRWYSWDTELYYFRARWYDPITGRWLSKDPIGIAGGLNQYVFCGDNPVNFRDPWGLWEFSINAGWVYAGGLTISRNSHTGRWSTDVRVGLGAGFEVGFRPNAFDDTSCHGLDAVGIRFGLEGSVAGELGRLVGAGAGFSASAEVDWNNNYVVVPEAHASASIGPLSAEATAGYVGTGSFGSRPYTENAYADSSISVGVSAELFAFIGGRVGVGWGGGK